MICIRTLPVLIPIIRLFCFTKIMPQINSLSSENLKTTYPFDFNSLKQKIIKISFLHIYKIFFKMKNENPRNENEPREPRLQKCQNLIFLLLILTFTKILFNISPLVLILKHINKLQNILFITTLHLIYLINNRERITECKSWD